MTMLTVKNAPSRLAAAIFVCSLLSAPGETKLKESDHKNLSKLVNNYFTARNEEKGLLEAMQSIIDQIASIEKRLKGQKLLASVADWEQVFRLVTEERLKESLKKRGEVTEARLKGDVEVSIAYCVPKKPAKGALPLILIACDSGETPSAHLNSFWNDPAVREGAILVALDLGKNPQSWGLFGSANEPGGAYSITTALSLVQREFSVDCNRRFLVGSGKGFAAVETIAASYPQVFAGVLGIGDVSVADAGNLENFRSLPSLFLKGAEGAKAIEAKLGDFGYANCRLEPEGGAAQAWEWMGKNPRNAYPMHLTFVPKRDTARFMHWVSLEGFQSAENPRIEAKADRATNAITVEAQKISDLIVYLNDELVDLDKPVKFVINGTTHERTVERSAPEMIMNQFYGGDWGRVFSASVTLDIPSK
jgi:hypothetical protein